MNKPTLTREQQIEALHKVTIKKSLKRTTRALRQEGIDFYMQLPDRLALRAFFHKVTTKRRETREPEFKVKYTIFLEPIPYFCRYNIGDEDLTEFQPVFFDSFQKARALYIRLLDLYYKKHRGFRKAGDLP